MAMIEIWNCKSTKMVRTIIIYAIIIKNKKKVKGFTITVPQYIFKYLNNSIARTATIYVHATDLKVHGRIKRHVLIKPGGVLNKQCSPENCIIRSKGTSIKDDSWTFSFSFPQNRTLNNTNPCYTLTRGNTLKFQVTLFWYFLKVNSNANCSSLFDVPSL